MEYKIGIVLALIAIVYAGCAETGQAAVASFVDYHTASADVTWRYINTYTEQTVTGVFTVSLPDRFSLRTNDHSVNWQRIYGYGELTAVVARSGQVEYKYESVQPFTVYQALFGELIADRLQGCHLCERRGGGRTAGSRYLRCRTDDILVRPGNEYPPAHH